MKILEELEDLETRLSIAGGRDNRRGFYHVRYNQHGNNDNYYFSPGDLMEVVKVETLRDVITIQIPCRGSGCRAAIRERVPLKYDVDAILQAHGWTRSGDQVGYWCPLCRPGAHQVQEIPGADMENIEREISG